MDTDKANIENVGNEAVRTAMKEIFLEMIVVLKKRVSDSAYADSVTTKLGFVFTSSMWLHTLLLINSLLLCTNTLTLCPVHTATFSYENGVKRLRFCPVFTLLRCEN